MRNLFRRSSSFWGSDASGKKEGGGTASGGEGERGLGPGATTDAASGNALDFIGKSSSLEESDEESDEDESESEESEDDSSCFTVTVTVFGLDGPASESELEESEDDDSDDDEAALLFRFLVRFLAPPIFGTAGAIR